MSAKKKMSQQDKSRESVTFLPEQIVVSENEKKSLLQSAIENDVTINHSCGGSGSCGTCLVRVISGLEKFPERGFVEKEMAQDRGFSEHERLACQNPTLAGITVEVPL